MSQTITVPKGLDKMSAEEQRMIHSMRADDAALPDPAPTPSPEPAARRTAPDPAATPDPAAASQVADAPAPAAEDDDDDDVAPPSGEGPQAVPHKVFHAERERRKATEARLAELEKDFAAKQARQDERLNLLIAAAQASAPPPVAAPPEEPLPDVAVDPVGHFRAVAERQAKQIEALGGIVQGMTQAQQRNAEVAQLRAWGEAQERAFMAREPSYVEAMAHLEQSRMAELAAIGVTDPAEQRRIIATDIHNIAVRSRQEGVDFAERLYTLAQKRGFQKAAAAAPAPGVPPMDASGATVAVPVFEQAPVRLQSGRDNAMTIGSAGAAPPTRLSVAKIADMNEAQFDALVSRMKGDPTALRDLLGH